MSFFEYKFKVKASNVNSELNIKNRTILEWMEDIGSMHSDMAECGLATVKDNRLSWIIIQWRVKLYRRVQYGEIITVRTWISGYKKKYTFREFSFLDEEGNLVAAASSKWVLTHLEKGLIDTPDRIFEYYGENHESYFAEDCKMERIKDPKDYSKPYDFTVPCTMIDLNGHMNNIYYLDVAYQAMPHEVFANGLFDEFEIMYRKELKLNDRLKCYYHGADDEHIITIQEENSGGVNAIVRFK